jgi:hypothetical protein
LVVVFKDGQIYQKEIILYQPVDVEKSKYEILGTKIELSLVIIS